MIVGQFDDLGVTGPLRVDILPLSTPQTDIYQKSTSVTPHSSFQSTLNSRIVSYKSNKFLISQIDEQIQWRREGFCCPEQTSVLPPPLVRSEAKSPPLPLEVGPLKSSYRDLERSPSENRIWCILALVIRRLGQTSKVPNNCQAVSGVTVTVRPSYCAGISSVTYCSLLTKPPNPFCSANANSPEAEFPNSRSSKCRPLHSAPGAHAHLPPPSRCH